QGAKAHAFNRAACEGSYHLVDPLLPRTDRRCRTQLQALAKHVAAPRVVEELPYRACGVGRPLDPLDDLFRDLQRDAHATEYVRSRRELRGSPRAAEELVEPHGPPYARHGQLPDKARTWNDAKETDQPAHATGN